MSDIEAKLDLILRRLDAQDKKLDLLTEELKKQNDILENFFKFLEAIHKTLSEILAALAGEDSGELVAALRKLTEAVNSLISRTDNMPQEVANRIKTINNGS